MDKNTFIKVRLSGKSPVFKDLVGLVESGRTSELCDFVCMAHPGADKVSQGSKSVVRTSKETYHYTIYNGFILKTWHVGNQVKRTLYKI